MSHSDANVMRHELCLECTLNFEDGYYSNILQLSLLKFETVLRYDDGHMATKNDYDCESVISHSLVNTS